MLYFNKNEFKPIAINNCYFLFGIKSLFLFEITRTAYLLLEKYESFDLNDVKDKFNELDELEDTVNELLEWNILSTVKYEKDTKPYYISQYRNLKDTKRLSSMYLTIAQDCNLRCKYCSAGFGKFGLDSKNNFMNKETASKVLEYFLDNLHPSIKDPAIIFVGGEPLMNFEIIQFVVEYLNSKGLKPNYLLNTNGVLMDDTMADWFCKNNIEVRFSIDGTKEIHDSNRVYSDGKGSYEQALRGFNLYRDRTKKNVIVQASIPHGYNYAKSVHNLWNIGSEFVIGNITSESAFLNTKEFEISESEIQKFIKEWELISSEIVGNIVSGSASGTTHNTQHMFNALSNSIPKKPGCGAGLSVSITPDGDIYPCHGFVGYKDYIIGDIQKGINMTKLNEFVTLTETYINKCTDCWARYLCGYACIAMAVQYNEIGDSDAPSRMCELSKNIIKSFFYTYNKLYNSNPNYFINRLTSKQKI